MATLTPEFSERYVELMNNLPDGLRHVVRPVLGAMGVGNTRHVAQTGGGETMLQAHPYLALVKRVADMSPAGLVPHIYRAALLKEDDAVIAQLQQGGSFNQVFGPASGYMPRPPMLGHMSRPPMLGHMPRPPMLGHMPPFNPYHWLYVRTVNNMFAKNKQKKAEENIVRDYVLSIDVDNGKLGAYNEANLIKGINESKIWTKVLSKTSNSKMKTYLSDPLKSAKQQGSADIIELEFSCMTTALIFVLGLTREKCDPGKNEEECIYKAAKTLKSHYSNKSHSTFKSNTDHIKRILKTDTDFITIIDDLLDQSAAGDTEVKDAVNNYIKPGNSNVKSTDADMKTFLDFQGGGADLAKVDSAMHTWLTEMAMRKLVVDLEKAKRSGQVLNAFHTHSPMVMSNMMAADLAARRGWYNRLSTVRGTPLMPGGGYEDFQKILPPAVHAAVDPDSKYAKMSMKAWAEANNVPLAPAAPQNGGGNAGISLFDL